MARSWRAPPETGRPRRLSHASGYALRVLTYLARHDAGPVTSHAIAEARALPERFLLKLLKLLVSAGVLHSLKGPNGGYRLARSARSITLLGVVEAVDGPLWGHASQVAAGEHDRFDGRLRRVCADVAEGVRRRLGKVSLADLAGEG